MKKFMFIAAALVVAGCMQRSAPTTPTSLTSLPSPAGVDQPVQLGHNMADMQQHLAVAGDKGYIDGWFNGETVQLYYTKAYFCEEPPSSGADSHCEVGAPADTAPRSGPIPTIYAIAAAGITPDPSTVSCPGGLGSQCLNHPAMLDLSRVRPNAFNAPPVPHSHILAEHHAGWFNTVNIRVSNLDVWNQIATAKSLDKVRELQADPNVGGKGLISQDTPTNIYFFIASWR